MGFWENNDMHVSHPPLDPSKSLLKPCSMLFFFHFLRLPHHNHQIITIFGLPAAGDARHSNLHTGNSKTVRHFLAGGLMILFNLSRPDKSFQIWADLLHFIQTRNKHSDENITVLFWSVFLSSMLHSTSRFMKINFCTFTSCVSPVKYEHVVGEWLNQSDLELCAAAKNSYRVSGMSPGEAQSRTRHKFRFHIQHVVFWPKLKTVGAFLNKLMWKWFGMKKYVGARSHFTSIRSQTLDFYGFICASPGGIPPRHAVAIFSRREQVLVSLVTSLNGAPRRQTTWSILTNQNAPCPVPTKWHPFQFCWDVSLTSQILSNCRYFIELWQL